ncbi:hypothetical protein AOCH_004187 [Aspergillus ochraceoroseus]|nr:hypothetical protein AOCH_004187 [Aspergillus ochraceoroseus]
MKNHYHGHPHGRAVERLAYTEVMDWKFYPATTTLLSVEGRVCSLDEERSTLVLQIQNWVLFHDDPDVNTVMSTLGNIWICRHNRLDCNASGFDIRSAIQTRGFRLEKSNTFECMGCPICGIEFQFDLRDCGTDGKAVLVTKWLDLGAGLGFNDPKWKRIIPDILEYRERRQLITSSGDIGRLFRDASCIEGQASNPTERNQSYLMGKRYRRLMSPKLGNMYWALL